ncbi:MAG: DHA2 family efflux MFS transporter permease subunit, partial [Candidatus Binataceae bacterium]
MAAHSVAVSEPSAAVSAHKWLIAIAVILGAILPIFDLSATYVSLPYMQGSFAASVDEIAWVVTSFLVAISVMIPMTGWLAARIGRKRYYIISLLLFMSASALCGASQSLGSMVFFRLIEGAAGAATMPLSQAILFETFPPAEQTMAMSVFVFGMMSGPILGPTVSGWVTMNLSWRWNFYIDVPVGAFAAIMIYLFVHDPPYLREQRGGGRVDYTGIICLAVGLGLLQIVLDRGQRSDWFAATWVCYFTLISAAALVILAFHELKFPDPILDLRALKNFGFTLAMILITLESLVLYSVNMVTPLFTQDLLGYDAWRSGLAVMPRGLGVIVALLVVWVLSRGGRDVRALIGLGFLLGAYEIWRMSHWTIQVNIWSVIWPLFLFGVGFGAVFPVLTACGLGQIAPKKLGFASSLFNMMMNTGAAIGIASVSNMITSREQIHQSYLTQHFSRFAAWKVSMQPPRMPGSPSFNFMHSLVTGQKQGLGMAYNMIQHQAFLMSYNDVYRTLALIALLCA